MQALVWASLVVGVVGLVASVARVIARRVSLLTLAERQSRVASSTSQDGGHCPQRLDTKKDKQDCLSFGLRSSVFALQYNYVVVLRTQTDGYGQNKTHIKYKCLRGFLFLVGVARLELAASWSRTMRATKLRYTPMSVL